MKNFVHLTFLGAFIAVFSGCTSGLALSRPEYSLRHTTYFAGTAMPHHSIEFSYSDEVQAVSLPNLSQDASLQRCLMYAAMTSPKLEASFHRFQASLSRIPQVSALPDPRLTLGYFIEEVQTRTGPMEQQLTLQQAFPWWGLLEAKGDVATLAANRSWYEYETKRLEIFELVTHRWTALVDLDEEIIVVEESFELLVEAERIARRSYEVDTSTHEKLVRLQVELGKLEDTLQRLRNLREPRVSALNALLARETNAAFSLPNSIELNIAEITLEEAQTMIRTSPALFAVESTIAQQAMAIKVATLDAKPKWTLGVTYTNLGDPINPSVPNAGDDPIMGMVGISIPLNQEKYDAAKSEAISKRLAAISIREALLHDLNAAIAESVYKRDDSVRRIELYELALIPRAEDSITAALTAFATGKTSVIELLDAQRTLLELQRTLQRSYASAVNADATISKLVGGNTSMETNE